MLFPSRFVALLRCFLTGCFPLFPILDLLPKRLLSFELQQVFRVQIDVWQATVVVGRLADLGLNSR